MYDAIIIGGGPAGLTAGIYMGRADKNVLIIDNGETMLRKSYQVANYPGFPGGIKGETLIRKFEEQAREFGTKIKREQALTVEKRKDYFLVETNKKKYQGKGLLIATGVDYKNPQIENVKKFIGKGVAFCVACDGAFFEDKKVIVIGAKNYAAKEALELLNYTEKITIYTNGKKPKMDKKFIQLLKQENIPIKTQRVRKISGKNSIDGTILEDGEKIECDGVFIALGDLNATALARKLGLYTEEEFIKVDKYGKTNLERVYAAGDCTGVNLQIAIAVGEGANAALNLLAELTERPKGQMKDYS